jgi:nitrile hydratase accessory protein
VTGRADPAYLLDPSGPAAPPRDNGELTFAAPWEGQAFGIALTLHDAGYFNWEDFRQALIHEIRQGEIGQGEIGQGEAARPSGESWSYYDCWLRCLERMVCERGLVSAADLRSRAALLAVRPTGHDHHDPPAAGFVVH